MTERRSTILKEKKNKKNNINAASSSPKKKFKPLETLIHVRVQEIEDNVGKFPNYMKFIKDLEKQYKKVWLEYVKNSEKLMLNLFAKGHKY
jgi:hypothetical protein